ncbi:acyltransferase [Brachybacterium tyrofermentans]|uniref:Acyltransferase n=1 Tax=Brachybacterium tyrofermentans TaxID=47848 RepID=A0ABW0FG01_9MICO
MTRTPLTRAEKVDAATPESLNRVVDFLRAAVVTVVVFGHWTIIAVVPEGGNLPHGVLDGAAWTHPLTWVREDVGYAQWLRTRLRRLGIPLIPLLLAGLVISIAVVPAGAENATVQLASQMALILTQFLAAYLMVILVEPPCLVLWERLGWWSITVGIALAGAVDALILVTDQPLLGYPNYLLVWAAFHRVGYVWLDGRLTGAGRRLLLAEIGLVGMTGLSFVTVLVNQRIMTWFPWHLTVMVGVAHQLLALDARVLLPEPLSEAWWATRPLWATALPALTGVVLLVMGRFGESRTDERTAPVVWKPLAAGVTVIAGLAVMANASVVSESGMTWWCRWCRWSGWEGSGS